MAASQQEPAARTFGELFDWHLAHGTRPAHSPDNPGKPWTNKEFSLALRRVEDTKVVRNWRRGINLPYDLASVETILFGDNATWHKHRSELRDSYSNTKKSRVSSLLARSETSLVGPPDGSGRKHKFNYPDWTARAVKVGLRIGVLDEGSNKIVFSDRFLLHFKSTSDAQHENPAPEPKSKGSIVFSAACASWDEVRGKEEERKMDDAYYFFNALSWQVYWHSVKCGVEANVFDVDSKGTVFFTEVFFNDLVGMIVETVTEHETEEELRLILLKVVTETVRIRSLLAGDPNHTSQFLVVETALDVFFSGESYADLLNTVVGRR